MRSLMRFISIGLFLVSFCVACREKNIDESREMTGTRESTRQLANEVGFKAWLRDTISALTGKTSFDSCGLVDRVLDVGSDSSWLTIRMTYRIPLYGLVSLDTSCTINKWMQSSDELRSVLVKGDSVNVEEIWDYEHQDVNAQWGIHVTYEISQFEVFIKDSIVEYSFARGDILDRSTRAVSP